MAKFEGVKWAPRQMRYTLGDKQFEILEADAKVPAVSRSILYGLFLAFEGIRFCCRKGSGGEIEVIFLNWHKNLGVKDESAQSRPIRPYRSCLESDNEIGRLLSKGPGATLIFGYPLKSASLLH